MYFLKVDPVAFVSALQRDEFQVKLWTHYWLIEMTCIWFKVLYKYGSVVSVQIYCSYFSKGEENHKYVKKKIIIGEKLLAVKGVGGDTTVLVSKVVPDKTKILIFIYL